MKYDYSLIGLTQRSTIPIVKAQLGEKKYNYLIINEFNETPVDANGYKLEIEDLKTLIKDFYIQCCKENATPMIFVFNSIRAGEDRFCFIYDEYEIQYSTFADSEHIHIPQYRFLHTNWGSIESDALSTERCYFPYYPADRKNPSLTNCFWRNS